MLKYCYLNFSFYDLLFIKKVFDFEKKAHKDQRRHIGESYIYHSIAVPKIFFEEIGLDSTSISASLLHDVVEDTNFRLKDI